MEKLYVFSQDKSKLVYIFDSYVKSARELTPKFFAHLSDEELNFHKNYRHIKRNINKDSPYTTEIGNFYLVEHPNSTLGKSTTFKPKEVYVLNILTGSILNFNSFHSCLEWFERNKIKLSYYYLSKLANEKSKKGVLFKATYLFSLSNDFNS